MGKTWSEDLRGRVIVAIEGGARRNSATVCFGIAAATVVRWLQMWRKAGAHPVIPMGTRRRSTSRWSRRPGGECRFVPSPIGRFFKRQEMSFKTTAHASERSQAVVRRGIWRFEQDGAPTQPRRTRRAIPSARPYSHWPITTCTDALRLQGIIVRMRLDVAMNGRAVRAYVEHVLAAEAAAR